MLKKYAFNHFYKPYTCVKYHGIQLSKQTRFNYVPEREVENIAEIAWTKYTLVRFIDLTLRTYIHYEFYSNESKKAFRQTEQNSILKTSTARWARMPKRKVLPHKQTEMCDRDNGWERSFPACKLFGGIRHAPFDSFDRNKKRGAISRLAKLYWTDPWIHEMLWRRFLFYNLGLSFNISTREKDYFEKKPKCFSYRFNNPLTFNYIILADFTLCFLFKINNILVD